MPRALRDQRVCPSCLNVTGPSLNEQSWQAKLWLALTCLTGLAGATGALLVLLTTPAEAVAVFAATGTVLNLGVIFLAFDAILSESKLQSLVTSLWVVYAALFTLYYAVELPSSFGAVWVEARWAFVSVVSVPGLLQALFVFSVIHEQSYVAYKTAGASPLLQRQYQLFRNALALLKLDWFATALALLMACTLLKPEGFSGLEIAASGGALAFAVALGWLGWLAIVRESVCFVCIFFFGSLLQPALMAWKLWLLWSRPELFAAGVDFASLGTVCAVAMILRASLLVTVLLAARGFGSGLKEVAFQPMSSRRRRASQPTVMQVRPTGSLSQSDSDILSLTGTDDDDDDSISAHILSLPGNADSKGQALLATTAGRPR